MPKMDDMLLYQKLKNIDPSLLFCFITVNREYVEYLKKDNPNIEELVLYKPIHFNELRNKVHFLLLINCYNDQQQDKKQLLAIP